MAVATNAPAEISTPFSVFDRMASMDHEEVVFCHDKSSGLRSIIAIHNTVLGPALGGTRFWNYASDQEAITDALRLSRGMTYKAAITGLHLGGGKAVIIGDSRKEKSEALFRRYGKFVQSLGGKYITAEDVGTSKEDM
ncbi:MAG: Glu/Leu/Phe/Val dehydrogenase dimerization domain-containing protein [Chitinophagales bacterium]